MTRVGDATQRGTSRFPRRGGEREQREGEELDCSGKLLEEGRSARGLAVEGDISGGMGRERSAEEAGWIVRGNPSSALERGVGTQM